MSETLRDRLRAHALSEQAPDILVESASGWVVQVALAPGRPLACAEWQPRFSWRHKAWRLYFRLRLWPLELRYFPSTATLDEWLLDSMSRRR